MKLKGSIKTRYLNCKLENFWMHLFMFLLLFWWMEGNGEDYRMRRKRKKHKLSNCELSTDLSLAPRIFVSFSGTMTTEAVLQSPVAFLGVWRSPPPACRTTTSCPLVLQIDHVINHWRRHSAAAEMRSVKGHRYYKTDGRGGGTQGSGWLGGWCGATCPGAHSILIPSWQCITCVWVLWNENYHLVFGTFFL